MATEEAMQQASFRHLRLLGGIWGSYIVGAICGSALELHMALFALVFPLCVLALLIVMTCSDRLKRDWTPSGGRCGLA